MKETYPLVRGKIKCFLTGVKGFQFKKRTTYELQAYIDDGSLISEVLIDHDVVQKGIGYSPFEVTAALSSSDTNIAQNMKETMRKFQAFLANFEGVILVQLNRKYSLPLALDMSQGCPKSDAWSLLRRLKSHHPAQAQKHFPSGTIVLSP
ncbi:recQ-mediated genome instability protein 1 [Trifolium repens]|nr:recQ-mediated genome instability protein 1 [Trifolium repens]